MITGTTDASLIKELLALVKLAIDMRRLQRIYYRLDPGAAGKREALAEARDAERRFDQQVAAFKMPTLL